MAKTYIGASGSQATVANETSYWFLGGGIAKSTTEVNQQTIFRLQGTLSNLYVRVTANTITTASTLRTRKNVANGGQSVSITASTSGEFTDSSGTDTVAATDKFCYQFVPGAATNTLTFYLHSCIFDATTDTVTRTVTMDATSLTTASTTWYAPLTGRVGTATTTETNAKRRMRKSFTLRNVGANVTTNRATTSTLRSRKNGANGNLAISITGGGATGWYEDTSSTDTVSAGEDWNWSIT